MAYSGKTIAAAKAVLADRVTVRQAQADRRLAEVYQKLPQVRRIDSELRSQMMELAMAVFQKDNSDDLEKMAARNLKLQSSVKSCSLQPDSRQIIRTTNPSAPNVKIVVL